MPPRSVKGTPSRSSVVNDALVMTMSSMRSSYDIWSEPSWRRCSAEPGAVAFLDGRTCAGGFWSRPSSKRMRPIRSTGP